MKIPFTLTVTHHQSCKNCDKEVTAGSLKWVWVKFFFHLKMCKKSDTRDLPFFKTLWGLLRWQTKD